jgi:hypothetical protein
MAKTKTKGGRVSKASSAVKKAQARPKASAAAKAPLAEGDDEKKYSLEQLATDIPAALDGTRDLVLGSRTEAQFFALGTDYSTDDILRASPRFFAGAFHAWQAASAADRALLLGVSPSLIRVGVDLGLDLQARYRDVLAKGPSGATRRRQAVRAATSSAVSLRDRAIDALDKVVPATGPARDQLAGVDRDASSPETLAAGLERLASVVKSVRKSGHAAVLDDLGITDALGSALVARAAEIRDVGGVAAGGDPTQAPGQRELDKADGRVLYVVQSIARAFRDAHASNEAIVVPNLGALRRLLAKSAAAEPAATPVQTNGKTDATATS